ncbi:hypothetical protein MMYC01_206789 [Madurella mycetomatis]|uniref:Rhodopsin domain-containing protein n=1 Tax=Madurella mycetomatis TaxID=100816 RepID=A0A175W3D6_9PEZI|nr:hypothetical protein MMYC01_206789 [Madurella mycetomatis]
MAPVPALPPYAFEDKSGTIIGVVVFCLLWATFMVSLRLWTRWRIIKQVGIDDYACVSGLLMACGSGIAVAQMTEYGLGKHIYVVPPRNVPLYFRAFYVSIIMYSASLLAIKLTFLFQYYRSLAGQHMRVVYVFGVIIVGGWALSQVFVGIFLCYPIDGFWDSTIQATCITNVPLWYINAAGNIITDVAVFAFPFPVLWKLHLPRPQKLVLLGVFSLGFFTVIFSIIRIRYLKMFEDSPWENVDIALWSIGELTSALTCACLPTLRPLVVRHFPSLQWHAGQSPKGQRNVRWYANRQGSEERGVMDVESAACRTHNPRIRGDRSPPVRESDTELREYADSFDMHFVRISNDGKGS